MRLDPAEQLAKARQAAADRGGVCLSDSYEGTRSYMRWRCPGYFEGDVTELNPFRDHLADRLPYRLDANGCVTPPQGNGIGLKIDLDFIKEHPLIEGPCYV